ncbi:phage portal protein [Fimbriiglobus ruber]|uniref:Phage portal protein n=1 Tax=Fimbriiglobus ruber TaxID=1908690 RepID=A0A225D8U4_9BACT|nr:phage portal protein [Fimbriiglobus ruber]OWK34958.1 Phage portal protein [Fimbriiglobus ruber]
MSLLKLLTARPNRNSNFRAATPENPAFDLNSPDAWDALGAERPSTGIPVSAESALRVAAWWRGITLLARDTAKTPFHTYKRTDGGKGKKLDPNHPAYHLLLRKANETQTALQFRQALTGHAINRGNGYAHIWRTGGGDPLEMLLLDPDRTEPFKASNGSLWYKTEINGDKRRLPAEDVFHLRGFGFDGHQGYPCYKMAKEWVGLGHAEVMFRGVRYRNQARPSVVLSTDKTVQPANRQALRQEWEKMHTGIENSHRTAILDNGLKATILTFTAEEMQEIEGAGLTTRQIANFLGIPSSKLGDVQGVKYASKEQDDQNYLDDGLDFWFASYEAEAWDKLLSPTQQTRDSHFFEFDRKTLIRADMDARARFFRTALGGQPWMTQNEVRGEMSMDPSDDPDANKLRAPLNMGKGGFDNDSKDPNPPDNPKRGKGANAEVRGAAMESLADATRRMVKRVGIWANKNADKPAKFVGWLDGIEAEHADKVREALSPPCRMLAACGVVVPDLTAALLGTMREEYLTLSGQVVAKDLPARVVALSADLETRLPTTLFTLTDEDDYES